MLGLAGVLFLFVMLALCGSWAWSSRNYLLAVPLTILFLAACVGLFWVMEHWGPT
jgi:hypothetical protein